MVTGSDDSVTQWVRVIRMWAKETRKTTLDCVLWEGGAVVRPSSLLSDVTRRYMPRLGAVSSVHKSADTTAPCMNDAV